MQRAPRDADGGGAPDPVTVDTSAPAAATRVHAVPLPETGTWAGPRDEPARYELLHEVGSGAEGTTWRARYWVHPSSPPVPVAVKEYRRPDGASARWPHDGTWQHLRQQYALLSGIGHSHHLVDTREVFLGRRWSLEAPRDGGDRPDPVRESPYAVMQWVEGVAPLELLHDAQVPLGTRLRWVQDVAAAVLALHSLTVQEGNALVHGDVKPQNCLVDDSGRLVLLDLGAAQHVHSEDARRGLHTPGYAAPEVVRDPAAPRRPASDVHAVGATALHLVTGAAPPRGVGADLDALAALVLDSAVVRAGVARRRRGRFARHLVALLDADPDRRAGTDLAAWADELVRIAAGPRRRRRVGIAALAVAALVAGVALAAPEDGTDLDLADLSTVALPEGAVAVYDADLVAGPAGWPLVNTPAGSTDHTAQGYALLPDDPSSTLVVSDPAVQGGTQEVLRARGRILAGQGMWGLWCRGSDADGSSRYRFLVSHTGQVGIFVTSTSTAGVVTETGTGWYRLTGLDLRAPLDLEARCADQEGVVLTLLVDGREVLEHRPTATVLGPGRSGLEADVFADVVGAPLQVVVTDVEQYSAPSA